MSSQSAVTVVSRPAPPPEAGAVVTGSGGRVPVHPGATSTEATITKQVYNIGWKLRSHRALPRTAGLGGGADSGRSSGPILIECAHPPAPLPSPARPGLVGSEAGFRSLPRVEVSIQVPLGADRVSVLGSAERNLKMLREALGVNIVARNGSVQLRGE